MTRVLKSIFIAVSLLLAFNLFGQPVKNVYYVSSSVGDDANDGSIEKPFRTVNNPKIPHKDVIIRLKCGDVFFESLSGYTGVVIESYGRGKGLSCVDSKSWKIRLHGFRQVRISGNWTCSGTTVSAGSMMTLSILMT